MNSAIKIKKKIKKKSFLKAKKKKNISKTKKK